MARTSALLAVTVAVLCLSAVAADTNRDALMDLYQATNGASWTNNAGWGSESDYCTWFGIKCTIHTKSLIQINLPMNNLVGSIPASIGAITSVKIINLSNNKLSGRIPPVFGSLGALQEIWLNDNQLSGSLPSNMINLTFNWPTLQQMNLQNNQLTGSIPEDMFGPETLPPFAPALNLQVLRLDNNKLTGSLPERLIRGASLNTLMIPYNQLTDIPASLTPLLESLKYCALGGNDWNCPINSGVSAHCQAYCKSA